MLCINGQMPDHLKDSCHVRRAKMPRIVHSWLRNYLACMAMYFAVGSMWVYYIYWCFGNVFFGPGRMPGVTDVFEQIRVRALAVISANTAQLTQTHRHLWLSSQASDCPRCQKNLPSGTSVMSVRAQLCMQRIVGISDAFYVTVPSHLRLPLSYQKLGDFESRYTYCLLQKVLQGFSALICRRQKILI